MTNEEAKELLADIKGNIIVSVYSQYVEALEVAIKALEQQRQKGRWIQQEDIHKHHYGWLFCSECGAFLMSSDGANFCSCCGAKMEVDE